MKITFLALTIFLAGFAAHAGNDGPSAMAKAMKVATSLQCKLDKSVKYPEGVIKKLKLENIDSKDVTADLPSQSVLEPFSDVDGVTAASFSDQCDNMYSVGFKTEDFKAVIARRASSISGDLSVDMNYGGEGDVHATAAIKCKVVN